MKARELGPHATLLEHRGKRWNVLPAAPLRGPTATQVQLERLVDRYANRLATLDSKIAKCTSRLNAIQVELTHAQATYVHAEQELAAKWVFKDAERHASLSAEMNLRRVAETQRALLSERDGYLRERDDVAHDPTRWRVAATATAWSLDGMVYEIDGVARDPNEATLVIRDAQIERQRALDRTRLQQHPALPSSHNSSAHAMSSAAGAVYVLLNPRDPDAVKIGGTARTAAERAKEISQATGVAVPLIVICEQRVSNWRAAEAELHARLARYRLPNREFFTFPVKDAIELVQSVAANYAEPSLGTARTTSTVPSAQLGLAIEEGPAGLQVKRVATHSRAARAGFRPGDVVEGCDGQAVDSVLALQARVYDTKNEVRITVRRGTQRATLTLTRVPATPRAS